MRNWTPGNNEPLAVPTYISEVSPCCVKTKQTIDPCF